MTDGRPRILFVLSHRHNVVFFSTLAEMLEAGGVSVRFLSTDYSIEARTWRTGRRAPNVMHTDVSAIPRSTDVESVSLEDICRYMLGHPSLDIQYLTLFDQADRVLRAYSRHFDRVRPDVVAVWNGTTPQVRAAAKLAEARGIPVLYFEQGNFPATILCDPVGVNYEGSMRDFEVPKTFNRERIESYLASFRTRPPRRRRGPAVSRSGLVDAVLNFFPRRSVFHPALYFDHDKALEPKRFFQRLGIYLKWWLGGGGRAVADDLELPERFIFLPLQVHDDTQILVHSANIRTMANLVDETIEALPEGYDLVVKSHPADEGRRSYRVIEELLEGPRLHFLRSGHTLELIRRAECVVTINSTVGLEALACMKPVVVLGDAIYAERGITVDVPDLEEFPSKLREALDFRPDPDEVMRFLDYFIFEYSKPGRFRRPDPVVLKPLVDYVLEVVVGASTTAPHAKDAAGRVEAKTDAQTKRGPVASRFLILGWDGGTWEVFRPLVERGLMPNLKRLCDRGSYGVLESTLPPLTPPAWTTLVTGMLPQRHGIMGFFERRLLGDAAQSDGAPASPVSSLSVKVPDLLTIFGDAGRPVLCVNLPMTYPPRAVNGVMVAGMFTPPDARVFTYPPGLTDELTDYTIDLSVRVKQLTRKTAGRRGDEAGWLRRYTKVVRSRAMNVRRLARTHPFDLGIVIFTSTDRVFHLLWPEIQAYLKRDVPRSRTDHALQEFFTAVDDTLGLFLEICPDCTVMLVSDHGFGPAIEHAVYPNICLERNGYLSRRRGQTGQTWGRELMRGVRGGIRRTMQKVLPRAITSKVLARAGSRASRTFRLLDHERTVAHFVSVDDGEYGAVRLLEETTSHMSGAEREKLIDEIIAALEKMTDPETGEPVTQKVARTEVFLPDASVDFLPEITIRFRDGYTGRVDPLENQLVRGRPASQPGMHRTDGMFVLTGPAIKASGETASMHLADVAPTTLYASGLAIPATMQGEPPIHLFDDAYVAAHPVEKRDYKEAEARHAAEGADAYTVEQAQQVKDHLRHLGYID